MSGSGVSEWWSGGVSGGESGGVSESGGVRESGGVSERVVE